MPPFLFHFAGVLTRLNGRKWALIAFLLAAFLRALPIVYLEVREPGWHANNINEIEFYYDDVARSVISGQGFVHSVNPRTPNAQFGFTPGTPFHFVPPLYAWWVSALYLLFGPSIFLAKLAQCLIDSAVCVLLFHLGRRICSSETLGLIAAFLYATYPLAIAMCMTLYYQIPLNLLICWLLLKLVEPLTFRNGLWSGLITALSALAKPITLPLFIVLPLVKTAESLKRGQGKGPALRWSLAFIIAAVITIAPWTLRNYLVFAEFVPIQHGSGAVLIQGSKDEYIDLDVTSLREKYGQNFGVSESEFATVALNNHITHAKTDPVDYIRFLFKKFALSWYNTEGKKKNAVALALQLPYLLLGLVALGFGGRFWLTSPRWYVLAAVLYVCAVQVATFPLVRYTLAVMPVFMLIAAYPVYLMVRRVLGEGSTPS